MRIVSVNETHSLLFLHAQKRAAEPVRPAHHGNAKRDQDQCDPLGSGQKPYAPQRIASEHLHHEANRPISAKIKAQHAEGVRCAKEQHGQDDEKRQIRSGLHQLHRDARHQHIRIGQRGHLYRKQRIAHLSITAAGKEAADPAKEVEQRDCC